MIRSKKLSRIGGQQAFLLVSGATNGQNVEPGLSWPLGSNSFVIGPGKLLVSNIEPQHLAVDPSLLSGNERAIRRTVSMSTINPGPRSSTNSQDGCLDDP